MRAFWPKFPVMLFSSPMEMAGTSTGRTFGGPPLLGALGPLGLPGAGIAASYHMSFFFFERNTT